MRAGPLAASLVLVAAGIPAAAEQTRTATFAPSELPRGDAAGIALTSRGRMFLAPKLESYAAITAGDDPAQVFAAAADAAGNLFLATGPDGAVVRVTPEGKSSVAFRAAEPLVTALLLQKNGTLLAATAPGGKIYEVVSGAKPTVWCETGERYVWALAAAKDGAVLAATGDRGRLLTIDAQGHASVLFDSDEAHLVSIAVGRDVIWVGGSERGLVYRIEWGGRASVVYDDDDLPEAKVILPSPDGGLVVALDAAPPPERRLPAVRIRVAGSGGAADARSELDQSQGSSLQGVIEGLPAREERPEGFRLRGKIVALAPDGAATELWKSSSEAPFALATDVSGRTLFGTGEPARLWRVEGPREIALLATLKEAQTTAIVPQTTTALVATSNPAAVYRLDRNLPEAGTYVSPTADAGGVARWGTLSWHADGSGGRVELSTRTGNSQDPDGTWSGWSAAAIVREGSPIAGGAARFLQWRLRISGVSSDGPRISSVAASYTPRNRSPALRDLRIDPASGDVSGAATLRWSAADPDGDPLAIDIEVRKVGATEWKSAAHVDPPAPKGGDATSGDSNFREGKATWDTSSWEEGAYAVRAVASDQAANAPRAGLTDEDDLDDEIRVDRTPPEITARRVAGGAVDVTVVDAVSSVARLEILDGGKPVASPGCADGVCDGKRESFHLSAEDAGPAGARTLRATDAAGNSADAPVPAP
jgi:hypothetical protein